MENSSYIKMISMKPILLKAGMSLVLSLTGFIVARSATRKLTESQQYQNDEDIQEPNSCEVEDEMFGLKRRIEVKQDREWQIEKQFFHYQDLKDQGMQLMEYLNKMVLETSRVEYLEKRISWIEEANKRFEDLVVDYLNLFKFLEVFKSENGKLHKRVKKLLWKSKEQSRILRKQMKQIQCKETEISRTKRQLELKSEYIKLMEDEINEKNTLLDELRAAAESTRSKVGEETARMQEQDDEELMQLRWRNACLTGEMMMRDREFGSDDEVNKANVGEGGSYFGSETHNRANSRRRKLITKFKKWMEDGDRRRKNISCKKVML